MLTIVVFEGFREDYYSTYALRNASPLFTWVLAVIFLQEPINGWVITATLGVVAGSLFFYRSRSFSRHGLVGAALVGANTIFHKTGIGVSSPYIYPLFSYLFSVGTLGIYSLLHPREKERLTMTIEEWRSILPISVLAFLAAVFGFLAISLAPVTWIAPVARVRLFFGFLLSYFYLKERERWSDKLIGGMLILTSAALIAFVGR